MLTPLGTMLSSVERGEQKASFASEWCHDEFITWLWWFILLGWLLVLHKFAHDWMLLRRWWSPLMSIFHRDWNSWPGISLTSRGANHQGEQTQGQSMLGKSQRLGYDRNAVGFVDWSMTCTRAKTLTIPSDLASDDFGQCPIYRW